MPSPGRRRWKLRALALCVGLALAGLLLGAGEVVCRLLAAGRPSGPVVAGEGTYGRTPFFERDPIVGYWPRPCQRVTSVKRVGGHLSYDVVYTTDAHGRRVTPVDDLRRRARPILFFGCSFTFGEGVSDDETLPFHVARRAPNLRPLSYGCPGHGPQTMLARLQSDGFAREVAGERPILVYVYLGFHVDRAIGTSQVCNSWGAALPCYEEGRDGRLVRLGTFETARPCRLALYRLLGASALARELGVTNWPLRTREAHVTLTARMVVESFRLFREKLASDDCYVLLFPGQPQGTRVTRALELFLRNGIKCLDYSAQPIPRSAGYGLYGDPHPGPNAYRDVGEALVRDLGLGGA